MSSGSQVTWPSKCVCTSTKPGVTSTPSASTSRARRPVDRADLGDDAVGDRDVGRSRLGSPVPSTTVPPLITRSCMSAPLSRTAPPTLQNIVARGAKDLQRTGGVWERPYGSPPLAAPVEIRDDVRRLGVPVIAIGRLQAEAEVRRIRERDERGSAPPARRREPEQLGHRRRPQTGPPRESDKRPRRPAGRQGRWRRRQARAGVASLTAFWSSRHDDGVAGRGSLGRPRTISPMMLRCTCEVPA